MKKTQKPTIYDIAEKAGASASTVSAALNDNWRARRISEKTVQKIREIARVEGYSLNMQARGLRKAKSGLVGMILPEHNNRFFSDLSQSFANEVSLRGNCPAIACTGRDADEERKVVASLISYAIDSLFIVGATNPNELSQLCLNESLPHVFVDQPCEFAPSVVTDNKYGATELTNVLLDEMGTSDGSPQSKLYFVGGDATLPASAGRIEGFRETVEKRCGHVDPSQIIACGYDRDVARSELQNLRNTLGQLPAGLLVNSIDCFEGALKFLSELPEAEVMNCTIGCFDFDPFGVLLRFPVHMVRQRANKLIQTAYACIESESSDASLTLVRPELIRPDGSY